MQRTSFASSRNLGRSVTTRPNSSPTSPRSFVVLEQSKRDRLDDCPEPYALEAQGTASPQRAANHRDAASDPTSTTQERSTEMTPTPRFSASDSMATPVKADIPPPRQKIGEKGVVVRSAYGGNSVGNSDKRCYRLPRLEGWVLFRLHKASSLIGRAADKDLPTLLRQDRLPSEGLPPLSIPSVKCIQNRVFDWADHDDRRLPDLAFRRRLNRSESSGLKTCSIVFERSKRVAWIAGDER